MECNGRIRNNAQKCEGAYNSLKEMSSGVLCAIGAVLTIYGIEEKTNSGVLLSLVGCCIFGAGIYIFIDTQILFTS